MIKNIYALPVFLLVFFFFVSTSSANDSELFTTKIFSKSTQSFDVNYSGENSGVSIVEFTGNYDKDIAGVSNIAARKAVTETLYQSIPDLYDFLVVFTQFPVDSGEASAFTIIYENDVSGIGLSLFDNSIQMGSERLQATIDMTELSDWELDPSHRLYDSTLDVLIHEMMHRWGVHISFIDHNGQSSDLLRGRDDNHWSYFADSNASIMYGANWDEVSTGVFETTGISKSLSPLDLYLMGFNEPSMVSDFFIIDSGVPGSFADLPSPIGTLVNGSRVDISIQDIIAEEGIRIPNSEESQHSFNFKFVLLKRPDDQLDEDNLGSLVVLQRKLQQRFVVETQGLGAIVYPEFGDYFDSTDPERLSYDLINNLEVDVDSAVNFIASKFDGSSTNWRDKLATQVRDTAMSVHALSYLEVGGEDINSAVQWLNSYEAINNDELAWLLLSNQLTDANKTRVITHLINQVNTDGGWGLAFGSESSSFDTALVLWALVQSQGSNFNIASNTLMYVLNQINDDGGIGFSAGGKSSLTSSAMLLLTIYELTSDNVLEQGLIDFIISQQLPDNGFGSTESSAYESALVIKALSESNNQDHLQITEDAKTKLRTMQSVDGSFEGSIYTTALALNVLFNDQQSNLSLGEVSLSSSQAVEGEQFAINYQIIHQGEAQFNNISISLLLNQQIVASSVIDEIESNSSLNGQLILNSNGLNGLLDFEFVVDVEDALTESNEFDNNTGLTLDVLPKTNLPELAFDQSSIDVSPRMFSTLPFQYNISFRVGNLSYTDLSNVKVSLVQLLDDSVEVELHSVSQSIGAGLDELFNFNAELTSLSEGLEFVIVIDPNNEVEEVNEDNNRFNFQLEKIPTVDLSIGDSQISMPNHIIAGQQAPVNFEFSNLGTQTAPGFDVQAILNSNNDSEILFEAAIAELAGGETIERQFTWVPSENGEFNIDFIVDTVNAVAEVNETNNSISIPVVVAVNTITNLRIEDNDISISPDPGLAGQLIELTAVIKNTSSTESGTFDLNFYQSRANQPNTILAETTDNPSIPAGGEMAVSTLLDSNNEYGEITFIVELDPNNETAEFDENDNIGFQTFRVLDKPDAMVSSGGFSLMPSAPVLGETLGVKATIVNLGEQDLVDFEVKLFTKSGQIIQEVGSNVIPLVSSGQQVPTVFDFIFPDDSSIQELVIKVDPDNEIDEISENNNEAILIIENQSSEFYLTELYFSPNGDGVKDSTQIIFNFEIEDDYQINIFDEFNQVIREFPIMNSTTYGDYYWDGRDQSNNVVGDASYSVEVKGLNFNLSRRINVVVDTNRTTLLEAIKYDQGLFFDLGCAIDELTGQVDFSHDGKYLYTKEFKDKQGIVHNGFYRIKTDGKSVEPLLQSGFFEDHRINYYFVSNTGKVVLYVTNLSNGNSEIWTFNALTKAFQQLNTSFSNQYSIQLTTDLFSLVKITQNNNHSYYKVPHDELLNVENMIFNSDGTNLDRVKKLNQGWLWVVGTTENTYRYYYSSTEDSSNPQLLAEDSSSINFSVSDDGRYFTIYSEEELSFKYFQATNNQLNTMVDYQMESQLHQVYSQILRNNNLLLVKDSSIVIYNSSGAEIYSTPHGFNLSYFQQVIIDRFGSLDTMTYGWEAGVIDYTFNDLANLEINFNDIKINQADEDVLFIDIKSKLEGLFVYLDANVDISDTVSFYSKEDIKLRIDFSQLENIVVDELSEIDIENALFYERLSPLFLISESSYYKGFLEDVGNPSDSFWSNFGIEKFFPKYKDSSYIKKSLVNSNYLPYGISCSDSGDKFKGVFQSSANLTSFIKTSVNKGIVELNGSSFDEHFSGYIIEWKSLDQSNSTWQTLKSSESEVQDDFIMYWTPAVSGHYLLRLTSFDKAGNQVSDTDDVFIGVVNLDIINTDVYPKHFSPNGDGVLDNVTIAYEVLQPSDVEIEISNGSGEIVRTISREYLSGQPESLIWDGLNNQGQNLTDDIYTISFNNYSYQVVLDTTAPEVLIRMAENQDAMAYIWPSYPWASGITSYWFGSDLYTQEGQLKINSMLEKYNNQNQEWEPVSGISCGISSTEYFSHDLYDGDKYRCYTYDLAGNRSAFSELTIDIDPIYSRSLLKNLSSESITLSYDAFSCPKDYGYTEVTVECDDFYTLNHRDHPEIVDWNVDGELFFVFQSFSGQEINQVKMTTSYVPENSVDNLPVVSDRFIELANEELLVQELELNEEDLYREDTFPSNMFSSFKKYYLNLQPEHFPTTDSVVSVVFQFQYVNGETHDVELKIEFAQKSKESFISADYLFTHGIEYLKSLLPELNSNDENITASLESLLSNVEFNVDKNYWIFISTKYENISNSLATVSETDLDPINYLPIFETIHLNDESDAGHVIQLFEIVSDDCQIPLVTYSGVREDGKIIAIQKGLSGSLPLCVDDLHITQMFQANGQCDSNADKDDLIRLEIDGLIGANSTIPASLEIYRLDEGFEELLFVETDIDVNVNLDGKLIYQGYLEIDKSIFAAGKHFIFIRFKDIEGNEYEETSEILVQNQSVSPSVIHPVESQKYCATDSESGDIQVPVQVLFDNNGAKNLNAAQFINGVFQSELTNYSSHEKIQPNALNSTDKLFLEGNLYEDVFILKAPFYAGQTTVMFDVINSTGVSQCESVNIEVDSLIDADVSYLDQEHYISPLGSGHHLLVQFAEITAYEPLNVKVNVRQVFDNSPDVVVGNLYDMSLESGENIEMSWNGEIDGQLLPDGRYDLTVDIIDSCDILKREVVTIIIDSTAPQITFNNPVSGQLVNSVEEISLLVEDSNLDRDYVELTYQFNGIWTPIQIENSFINSTNLYEFLATWNLSQLPQDLYLIKANAKDLAGNETELVIQVDYQDTLDLVWDYRISNRYISPNDDQIFDQTEVSLGLNIQTVVSIQISDSAQNTVKTIVNNVTLQPGMHSFVWRGLDDLNQPVLDGEYSVNLTVYELGNSSNQGALSLGITVDNSLPTWELSPGSSYLKGEGELLLSLGDMNISVSKVWLQMLEPLGSEVLIAEINSTGNFELTDLSELDETAYQIRIDSVDLAGNRLEAIQQFEIDNTEPVVSLSNPLDFSFQGGDQSSIDFIGELSDKNFKQYEFYISPNVTPLAWELMFSGTESIENDFINNFETPDTDGVYLIKALALDQAGWETEAILEINIDTTPPNAELENPPLNSIQNESIELIGSVNDQNLEYYNISYKLHQDNDGQWILIHTGFEPIVNDQIMTWDHGLDSGEFDLKISAFDQVGLSSETIITFTIDTSPPLAPMFLSADLLNQQDVHLNWQASSSNEVVGYWVFRNNQVLNQSMITGTDYADLALPEGEFIYWVVAVDSVGNHSLPSNVQSITVDRTAPEVLIISPSDNQFISGIIDINGTAYSAGDFSSYQLYFRQQGVSLPGELLAQSSLPIHAQFMAELNTNNLVHGSTYIIRLESFDTQQNMSVVEHSVTVDKVAPSKPLNLSLQLNNGNDVSLSWTANTEADLKGYIIYRNENLIPSNGTIDSATVTDTNYQDDDLVDGEYYYYVVAVDTANNLSEASNLVNTTIDLRAPHAYFVTPEEDDLFDGPLEIVAGTDDLDVASILFEYAPDGSDWQELTTVYSPPYVAVLNPISLGLSYDYIDLKITATDNNLQTDPNPDQIYVEYYDLTPPEPVENLTATVTGEDIQLNWTANDDLDLEGYVVSRKRVEPEPQDRFYMLTDYYPYHVDNNYIDEDLLKGTYVYKVSAIDSYDNESIGNESSELTVFSVNWLQPYSPVIAIDQIDVQGKTLYQGDVFATLDNTLGVVDFPVPTVNSEGLFLFDDVQLTFGENELKAYQLTDDGHTSLESSVIVQLSPEPLKPLNPNGVITNNQLDFTWQAAKTDVAGYLPYLNHQPVYSKALMTQSDDSLYPAATSNNSSSYKIIDGDQDTYWRPSTSDRESNEPVYAEILFDGNKWVTSTTINWGQDTTGEAFRPENYLLQFLSPIGWVTQHDYSGDTRVQVDFTGALPYWCAGIRILIPANNGAEHAIRLNEVEIKHQPITNLENYSATLTNGLYDIQVSAINKYGFESELTNIQSLVVGDLIPPDSVTLSVTLQNENQALIEWTESPSSDVVNYHVYRNDQLIYISAESNPNSYLEIDLPNGIHEYYVVAEDSAGNFSDHSNTIIIDVQQQVLISPTGLVVSTINSGGQLSLEWDVHSSANFSYFIVYRSTEQSSGFEPLQQLSENVMIDADLTNGFRYYYYLTAIDQIGNESLPSIVASGVPYDLLPPKQPVINAPTVSGIPIDTYTLTTNILGNGSPATSIDLYRNEELIATTESSDQFIKSETNFYASFDDIRYNKVNSYFAGYDYSLGSLVIVDADRVEKNTVDVSDWRFYFWSVNGTHLYTVSDYGSDTKLNSIGFDGQPISTVFSGFEIKEALVSADESQIFYWGDGINPDNSLIEEGLWIYDISSTEFNKLSVPENIELNFQSIIWLANGSLAFINFPDGYGNEGTLWLYNAQEEQLSIIDNNTDAQSTLVALDDGTHLYYVKRKNNDQVIIRHKLSDGEIKEYAISGVDLSMPVVNTDKDLVWVNSKCCDKYLININDHTLINKIEDVGYEKRISWLEDGRIMYMDNRWAVFIVFPGQFEFEQVQLQPGVNDFYVVSRKDNGLESIPSESIEITLNESALSDLEIKSNYLQVVPSQVFVGDSISGSILIKNNSTVDVDQARVLIELVDPNLQSQLIEPSPMDISLNAGEILAETFILNNLSTLGEYSIRVVVDSNQQVLESNENNNTTFKTFQVIDDLNPDVGMMLDSNELSPGESLSGTIRVYNPGQEFSGEVHLRITDSSGFPVGYEQQYLLNEVNTGGVWEQAFQWDSTNYFAGSYLIELTLSGAYQIMIEQHIDEFEINEFTVFQLLISANSNQTPVNQSVDFITNINYELGNVSQNGTLIWQITDSNQQVIWSDTQDINAMSPGFNGNFTSSWQSDQSGTYSVQATLNTPLVMKSVSMPFEIISLSPVVSLVGEISELSSDVILGQAWESVYSIENNGETDFIDIPIQLLIWNDEMSQLIEQSIFLTSLNAGEIAQVSTGWVSDNLVTGSYVMVLSADLSSMGFSSSFLLDTMSIRTIDTTGPLINLLNPSEQGLYQSDIDIRVEVIDAHSLIESFNIFYMGQNIASFNSQQLNNVYQHWLTELPEGAHSLIFEATDGFENVTSHVVSFNVDSTDPVIEVVGVTEGGLYNHSVQANITVTDTNLDFTQITLDGMPYVSGTDINIEGNHILMAAARDSAGNAVTTRVSFDIDLTAPAVFITFPTNGSDTNQAFTTISGHTEVGANVSLVNSDYNDAVVADFAGEFSFADVPLSQGNNLITVTATDSAGNLGLGTEVNVVFADDIDLSGQLTAGSDSALGQDLVIDWQVNNENNFAVNEQSVRVSLYKVSGNQLIQTDVQNISIAANGHFNSSSVFGTAVLAAGNYRVELHTQINQIWQLLDDQLIQLLDVVGPEIVVVEPAVDQINQSTVNILVQATDLHSLVVDVSYELNGNTIWESLPWNGIEYSGQINLSHGTHHIVLKATDEFGNETISQSIQFYVDTHAPVINLQSPSDGLITNQPVHIEYSVTDDHTFETSAELNQVSINAGHLVDEEGAYELVVQATDEVSNQASISRSFIVDTTPPLLGVSSPENGASVTSGAVDIIGVAEERNVILVSINGVESNTNTNDMGQFTFSDQQLEVGMNTIEVTATDQAGNTSSVVTLTVEYVQVASVSGQVWQDDNQNMVVDSQEVGLGQVLLSLTDSVQNSTQIQTDMSGNYIFDEVLPGMYSIEVVDPELVSEWQITTANNPFNISVSEDQNIHVDFGFYQEPPIIDANILANNLNGRLLILVDPVTAQADYNQCIGVTEYLLQRNDEQILKSADMVWAKLYDSQGTLLQIEQATYNDFINSGSLGIDQQTETSDFNLVLLPVANNSIGANVMASSIAIPEVISNEYSVVLGGVIAGMDVEWSSDLISAECQMFEEIGLNSGDLQMSTIKLTPPVVSDDPFGTTDAPYLSSQYVLLENLLSAMGWSYQLTDDISEFNTEMQSGQYVAYWLMAENVVLPIDSQQNLISAVENGASLMVSSGYDNLSTQTYSSLGVEISGQHTNANEIVIFDSPLASNDVLSIAYEEQPLKVSLIEAQSAAVFSGVGVSSPDNMAVTWLDDLAGSVVFSAIDWLLQATADNGLNQYTEILKNVLSYINPIGLSNELGYARSIVFNMQNYGRRVNGFVQVSLPPSLTLVHTEIPTILNQDGFTFEYDLSGDQLLDFEFWIRVEESPATVTFDIYLDDNPEIFDSVELVLIAGERPDLSVSLSNCQVGLNPNQFITYQYHIENIGNKDINEALTYVDLGQGLELTDWTCSGHLGGVCSQVNGTSELNGISVDLPAGSSVHYSVNSQVMVQTISDVSPSGYVVMPENITDIDPSNNYAVDKDAVYSFLFKNGFECSAPGAPLNNMQIVMPAMEGR